MAKFRSSSKPLRTFKAKPRAIPKGKHPMAIDTLAEDGRGVARMQGKTVFVTGALPGEQVEAIYQQTHKNFDEALVVKVVEASPQRVEPVCPYYARCGGCNLQHLSNDQQRDYKQHTLQRKFSSLAPGVTFEPSLLGEALAYRHRVRFAIKADRRNFQLGFRQADSHQLVDINECSVLRPAINAVLPIVKALLGQLKSRSSLVELSISEADDGQLGLLLLVKQAMPDEDLNKLAALADKQKVLLDIYQLKGKEKQLLVRYGKSELFYTLNDKQLTIPFALTDFTQVNPEINQWLVDTATHWLELDKDDVVADYFCGIGNFTLPMATQVGQITGYELVTDMVAKASHNAELNQISNSSFKIRDLMSQGVKITNTYNKVLLDPPRAGAEALCKQLVASSADKILYISCNPKTLYRDAGILVAGGYKLVRIALADMFPQTSHSEVVALFVPQ